MSNFHYSECVGQLGGALCPRTPEVRAIKPSAGVDYWEKRHLRSERQHRWSRREVLLHDPLMSLWTLREGCSSTGPRFPRKDRKVVSKRRSSAVITIRVLIRRAAPAALTRGVIIQRAAPKAWLPPVQYNPWARLQRRLHPLVAGHASSVSLVGSTPAKFELILT